MARPRLADAPLEARMDAARSLIERHPEMGEDERFELLALALWPESATTTREPTTQHLMVCHDPHCFECAA